MRLPSDLGLIGSPAKVARRLLEATPERISLGRIHYQDQDGNPASRYFIVAAGIGADALVMARMDAAAETAAGLCALPRRVLPHLGYVFVSVL